MFFYLVPVDLINPYKEDLKGIDMEYETVCMGKDLGQTVGAIFCGCPKFICNYCY